MKDLDENVRAAGPAQPAAAAAAAAAAAGKTDHGHADDDDDDDKKKTSPLSVVERHDGVVEPNALVEMREYMERTGATPTKVLELLQTHYRGYGPMARLVCEWTTHHRRSIADDHGGSAAAAAAAGVSAANATQNAEATNTFLWDKSSHLMTEIFDGAMADASAFGRGASPVDVWLDALIAQPSGRELVYRLAAANGGAEQQLLQFAIYRIESLGLLEELARQTRVAKHFPQDVFHRIVTMLLKRVIGAETADAAIDAADALRRLSVQSEETFIYVLAMLSSLAREHAARIHDENAEFAAKRLLWFKERLEQEGIASASGGERGRGAAIFRLSASVAPRLVTSSTSYVDSLAASIVANVAISSSESTSISLADLRKLLRVYESTTAETPSNAMMEQDGFVSAIVRELFSSQFVRHARAQSSSASERQTILRRLLAVAVASTEDGIDALDADIQCASEVACCVAVHGTLLENRDKVDRAVASAPAAAVLLRALDNIIDLRSPDEGGIGMTDKALVSALELISTIAERHAHLHSVVLGLLIAALDTEGTRIDTDPLIVGVGDGFGPGSAEAAAKSLTISSGDYSRFFADRSILQTMVRTLILRGYVTEPLNFIAAWSATKANKQQLTIVRECMVELLGEVYPPYSSWFAERIAQIADTIGLSRSSPGYARLQKWRAK